MAANDLIAAKKAPSGDIVGLEVSAGDSYFLLGNGPIIQATDPILLTIRYFRMNVQLQDNGDGTTSAVPILQEITLS